MALPKLKLVLSLALATAALAAGCGDDDENGGGGEPAAKTGGPAKTAEDAQVQGPEGQKIAEVTVELLNAKDGDEPCYAIVASDYVESLGGLPGCAKKMGPIATGPLDTIVAAGPIGDGERGEAVVESADGGTKQTIVFAKTVAGEWRVDGLKP